MTQFILTVEDSTSLREMITFTLNEASYCVIEATDGMDALDKLNECEVDMVITDLNMPRMNGIELTRRLRANQKYRFTPILFLTTESQTVKKEEARCAGATGWIIKPFKPDKLVQIVKKVLR